ncbi:phage holin family protein [Calothrix sp. NIES-3974]|uniref:phage holin family protein n=1 Tax=Calothrix sp. NIES-3974 TaxID=2005462 RepID=UPI000B5DBFE3|nr:phage holin family protein [Calothrix sp. NIES-3974]BAZ08044.1 hypothetical protein NIES3974_47130 [Calothrix sp. NIES-3974]
MKNFILTWLGSAIALLVTSYLVAQILPNGGFVVTNFNSAMIAAAIIGLINAFIRPILKILTFPITLLTFGLFAFVLNAALLMLASNFTPGGGFQITSFPAALIGSIILSIVSSIINVLIRIV